MFHPPSNTAAAASPELDKVQPCPHMALFLSGLSDGTLRGLTRWYAEQHTARCDHCAASLRALLALRQRLRALGHLPVTAAIPDLPDAPLQTLTPERRAAVEAAWTQIENNS